MDELSIVLEPHEATDDQLRRAIAESEESARLCRDHNAALAIFETHTRRAESLRHILQARVSARGGPEEGEQ
jgi:hypothetical protein